MFGQINKTLVETVILALHISVFDKDTKNVFVKATREVTLQQFVVVNGLGYDSTDEFVVTQVIWIAMRGGVDHVGDTIAWTDREQGVHRIENLSWDDDVPLSQ